MKKMRSVVILSCCLINPLVVLPVNGSRMKIVDNQDRPYDLAKAELSVLEKASSKGDCAAAYRVAQYHLYASLDMEMAKKHYRLAARCPIADALAGLITVLRRPEDDAEIDELLVVLRKLDPHLAESTAIDVADRRTERNSK